MKRAIQQLHPASFAMVMATGIVAIAAALLGFTRLGEALTWLNIATFLILSAMTLARLVFSSRAVLSELADHNRGAGHFTLVAGTSVLASELILVFGDYGIATTLWFVAVLLWVVLTYAIFAALTVTSAKPPLGEGIHGGWLVSVVATQSVSNLAGMLVPKAGHHKEWLLFLSLCLWLFGGMLYIWLITLIFYRYTFFRFSPADFLPTYWVNMGAMAISTLAGATLIANAAQWRFLELMLPFLHGFTVLFWATATWWIPLLFVLGFWRHVYKRFSIAYDPLYWGAVFPLGMYTVCSFQLAQAANLPMLYSVARYFVYIALAAWLATFIAFLHSLRSRA